MRVRSTTTGPVETTAAAAQEPAPPPTSQVACPECFQVGQHLDGCPEASAPAAARSQGNGKPEPNGLDPRLPHPASPPAIVTHDFPAEMIADGAHVVEVVWGKEYMQPIQFHGIEVGPFRATSAVRKGESEAQAVARVHAELAVVARAIRAQKVAEYIESLKMVFAAVQQARV